MKYVKWCFFLSIIINSLACVEELDYSRSESAEFIVVDGILNYHTNVESNDLTIRLDRSVTSFANPIPITDAEMELIVNETDRYDFVENEPGVYKLGVFDIFEPGSIYQLRFKIEESTYESTPEIMPDTVALVDVNVNLNPGGDASEAYEILIDLEDDNSQTNFYRWLITQWEKQDYCEYCYNIPNSSDNCGPDLFAKPGLLILRNNLCDEECYDILRFSPNNTISDVFIDGQSLLNKSIGFVPYNFPGPCLIEVKQSTLTAGYFAFLEILRSQAETTGGLADTPAALLTGNIKNLDNDTEKVVGYFSVTNNSVRRVWLDRSDASAAGMQALSLINPPIASPTPQPASWNPVPCEAGTNRTPIKPLGWQE